MNALNIESDNFSQNECDVHRKDSCHSHTSDTALDELRITREERKISIRYKFWLIYSAMLGIGGLSCFLSAVILDSRQGSDPVVVKTLKYQLFISMVVCFVCGLFTLGIAMTYKRDSNSRMNIKRDLYNTL